MAVSGFEGGRRIYEIDGALTKLDLTVILCTSLFQMKEVAGFDMSRAAVKNGCLLWVQLV